MTVSGVAEHVQRRSGGDWRELIFSRLIPAVFFSLFLARQLLLVGDGVQNIHKPSDALFVLQQSLALAYFTLLVVLYATRVPKRGSDRRPVVFFFPSSGPLPPLLPSVSPPRPPPLPL